jgi:hypothetical protein
MINHLRKDFLAQILKNTLTVKKIEFSETRYYFRGWRNSKGVFVLEKGAKLSKSGAFGKDQILRFIKEGYHRLSFFALRENFRPKQKL